MNKQEFVEALAAKSELSKAESGRVLDHVLEIITSCLSKSEEVRFTGFGSFKTRSRAARNGRNPATGKDLKIPASVVPAFKPGIELKRVVAKLKRKK